MTAEADSLAEQITSFARRKAQDIRSEGLAEAAKHYGVFRQNQEFAIFLSRLDALTDILKANTTFLLDGSTERAFGYFQQPPTEQEISRGPGSPAAETPGAGANPPAGNTDSPAPTTAPALRLRSRASGWGQLTMAEHPHDYDHDHDTPLAEPADAAGVGENLDPANRALADALRVSFRVLSAIMVLILAAFLLSGVFKVNSDERAVVLRFGKVVGAEADGAGGRVLGPNVYFGWPYPVDQVVRVPIRQQERKVGTFWFRVLPGEENLPLDQLTPKQAGLKPGFDGALMTGNRGLIHVRWTCQWRMGAANLDDPAAVLDYIRNVADPGLAHPVGRRDGFHSDGWVDARGRHLAVGRHLRRRGSPPCPGDPGRVAHRHSDRDAGGGRQHPAAPGAAGLYPGAQRPAGGRAGPPEGPGPARREAPGRRGDQLDPPARRDQDVRGRPAERLAPGGAGHGLPGHQPPAGGPPDHRAGRTDHQPGP